MRPVTRNVKHPDESTGRLPDYRIAKRMKRITGNGDRRRPAAIAMLDTRAENSRVVVVVFAFAAEKDQIKVAVLQFIETRRMFIVAGFDFRTEDTLDSNVISRAQTADDSPIQQQANKINSKRSAEVSGTVHAMPVMLPLVSAWLLSS